MGKPKKQPKKFMYDRNRRKEWMKKKKEPNIECSQLKAAWDSQKSVQANLAEMGLSADPNKTFAIPSPKDLLDVSEVTAETLKSLRKKSSKKAVKEYVLKELEEEAAIPQAKGLRLSEPEVEYCTYMMDKYGENYKAMAKDYRNYYQDTPKQIKRKITTFKGIPSQYNKYLATKNKDKMDTA